MKRTNKTGVWFRRLWALALAAGLVCALVGTVSAAPSLGAVSLPDASSPKPAVVIQGNVVVNKNKPTGFYELALCVRTARTVTLKDGTAVPEATYAADLAAALESGKPEDRQALDDTYDVTYYPFQSAAATVHIDLDALTAVTWGSGKPVYSDWTVGAGTAGEYAANDTGYPRGIDMTDPDNLENAALFTSLQKIIDAEAKDGNQDHVSVRLDTAKPDEVTNATALVEGYDAASNTALLTLTANTTTTKNVIYEVPTPVVVVRFAYDLNRFENTEVGDPADLTATPNESDFWAGLDKNNRATDDAARTALTYLAAGNGSASDPSYATSDQEAAETSIHQAVWYEHNMASDQVNQETTQFYYYLGAENKLSNAGTIDVNIPEDNGSGGWNVTKYSLVEPRTAGKTVLADKRSDLYATPGDPEAAGSKYSFFQNLLTMGEKTLRIELVNAETYRKPTGGGGINILFYDWDDSLIGSLIVDGGDVRSQVEEYVEENLVHPALRPSAALAKMGGKLPADGNYTTAEQQAYQTLINSLAREYTYRGKYAYQVGGDDTDLGVTDGEDYPLTNKLDYAFTKRVNTAAAYTVSDAGGGSHTETYVLPHKVTDADMVDAALYPYTYGWAVVEDTSAKDKGWKVMYDAKKIEDTWTTIGVGELSNVKPGYYDDGTATAQTLPSGTAKYQAPAFLADEDPHWVDPAEPAQPGMSYTNKYAYQLNSNSSAGYFRFADFSDIDAELEQYQTASGATKNTLIVKAVYEPGESLMDAGYYYRMVEEPYYNKLNYYSAAQGGAYSVQVTLERSDTTFGNVQGVARVRQPAVRQDTTYDQKWIQDNALGVDHNLNNASLRTAKALTETTFTRVDVENGDEVQFTLSLSGRQNKINYFIAETYGDNFVAGGLRSGTNFDRVGTEYTVENYNYFFDEDSDTGDLYFDVQDYADRDGSHGFVLYGTLNNLMQYATLYNHQEIDSDTYDRYVTYLILADANIRDKNEQPASIVNEATLKNALQDAARECETNHKGNPDYWNNDLDCAELTYHQLQWYIINGVLLDRATADDENHKLDFCHLHAACADLVSNKPKNWNDVMEAAAQRDADRLKQLSFDELRDLTHLRNNANGGDFSSRDVMINRLINAVNGDATLVDWVDVQKALLNGSGSVDTYWWYDGATANTAPGNWNALLDRVAPAITPVTYPDEVDRTTKAKLESVRSLFDANAAAGQNNATRQWINVTDNLILAHREEQVEVEVNGETMQEWHYTYTPLTDFDSFTASLVETVEAAQTGGFGMPSWEAVQYHILFPGETLDFINEPWTNVKLLNTEGWDPDADPTAKQWPEGFWWKGGNVPLTVDNIYTLLQAMEYLNGDDEDDQKRAEEALKAVDLARLEGQNFWLRKSKTGETWLERDETGAVTGPDAATQATLLADLLKDIQAAQAAGAINWNTLQYYLIHKGDPDPVDLSDLVKVSNEAYYYWWRQGGTGTSVTFPSGGTLNEAFPPLFEAAVRGEFGDPLAKASVEAQKVDGSFFILTRLTTSAKEHALDENTKTLDQLDWFTDTDALLTKMKDFMTFMQGKQGITDPYQPPDRVTWYQAQHWLLTGEYIKYGDDAYTKAMEDYWWYDKDERPAAASDPTPAVLVKAELYASGANTTVNVTADEWTPMNIIAPNKDGTKGTKVTSTLQAKTNMKKLVDEAKTHSEYYDGTHLNLTWAQIQYYFSTVLSSTKKGLLVTDAEAWTALKSKGWTASDVPEGVVIPAGVF